MRDIVFNLSLEEANQVVEALGNLPFVRVCTLIGKLQEQARRQLEGPTAMETPVAVEG